MGKPTPSKRVQPRSTARLTILALLLTALLIRTADLSTKSLWYDELQSVTYAHLPLADLLASVQRFDPHPPLYYLQLHLWMAAGVTDYWIKLNSVFWSLLTIAALYVVLSRIFDESVGILAAFFYTIFPFSVAYAQEARMYTQIIFLSIGLLYFTHHFLVGQHPWRTGGGLVVVTTALLYSHGAAFLSLFSGATYVVAYVLTSRQRAARRWQRLAQWLLLQGVIILLYLPWLAHAYAITVSHTLKPDVESVFRTLSILLLGFGSLPFWLQLSAIMLTVGLMALLLRYDRASRALILAFIIVPILSCLLISYLYRPIWLHRTLAYSAPFWAVTFALAVDRSAKRLSTVTAQTTLRYTLLTAVTLLFFFALRNQQAGTYYPWRIREAATFMAHVTEPGDQIYIPYARLYWGFNWYFLGPGSVNPLAPSDELTTAEGIHIFSVNAAQETIVQGGCYWVLYRDIDETAPFQLRPALIVNDFDGLTVARICLAT